MIALISASAVAATLSNVNSPLKEESAGIDETYCVKLSLFGLLGLCTILSSMIFFVLEFVSFFFEPPIWSGTNAYIVLAESLLMPELLLMFAMGIIAAQISLRWLRSGLPTICVGAMDPKLFILVWFGVIALLGIGIPLLATFGFSYWLGPWSPY